MRLAEYFGDKKDREDLFKPAEEKERITSEPGPSRGRRPFSGNYDYKI